MFLEPIKFLVWKNLGLEKFFGLEQNFEKKIGGQKKFREWKLLT